MRIIAVISVIALLALIAGFFFLQAENSEAGGGITSAPPEESMLDSSENNAAVNDSIQANGVIAYYFFGNRRCASCRKIEAYSRAAIEQGFPDELKNGTLEFVLINTDEKKNRHYIKDYQLYTKSLIISKIQDGKETKWKNLAGVWQLLNTESGFKKYVQDEICKYLEEK